MEPYDFINYRAAQNYRARPILRPQSRRPRSLEMMVGTAVVSAAKLGLGIVAGKIYARHMTKP